MTTPELPRSDSQPPEVRARSKDEQDAAFASDVVASAPGVLRVAAICAVTASALGVVIAPGLRGNATERIVVIGEQVSTTFAFALYALLVILLFGGAIVLSRVRHVSLLARFVAVPLAWLVAALTLRAFFGKMPSPAAVMIAIASGAAALASGAHALKTPRTRAVGTVLIALALSAMLHLSAWELAWYAGERVSVQLYSWSRGIATASVLVLAIAQLVATAWIGSRGGILGRLLSNLAIALAFVVTWGAARGVETSASSWQSIVHVALSDAPGLPPPYGISALAVFLVPSSLFLAAAALAQRRQITLVVAPLALALIARGSFDVPLHALAIGVAAQWLLVASQDPDRADAAA